MNDKSASFRAEIFDTGNSKIKSARIVINAPAEKIFSILADPKRHGEIDGTKTIQGTISGPDRLALGSKFGMKMRLGINYHVTNTVMEFEENRLIAWRHLGRWRWRYELKPLSPSQTEVTETFDGTTSISQTWLKLRKAYPWVQIAAAKTLVRLKTLAESD
ncbi:MAG: SRPBCC family protein [Actinobacteria bacterium]|nr:SRPBCC family protein [Actinomycetota bacterium]